MLRLLRGFASSSPSCLLLLYARSFAYKIQHYLKVVLCPFCVLRVASYSFSLALSLFFLPALALRPCPCLCCDLAVSFAVQCVGLLSPLNNNDSSSLLLLLLLRRGRESSFRIVFPFNCIAALADILMETLHHAAPPLSDTSTRAGAPLLPGDLALPLSLYSVLSQRKSRFFWTFLGFYSRVF